MNLPIVRRPGVAVLWVGCTFALVSLGFGVAVLYDRIAGPAQGPTVAEWALMAVYFAVCFAASAYLLLQWRFERLILTDDGIEHWNCLNRMDLRARWEELTRYQSLAGPRSGASYNVVYAGTRKANIGSDDTLLAEIKARAPQIVKRW